MVHIFPNWIGSLLSIGLLTDVGCSALFLHDSVVIKDSSDCEILRGYRSPLTKMWAIDLAHPKNPTRTCPAQTTSLSATVITEPQGTQANIVAFYHGAMGSPAASTFLSAIKKKFLDFPGLTLEIATKYMPHSTATAKGHMDQSRQGHRSTAEPTGDETDHDLFPIPEPRKQTRLQIQTKVIPVEDIRHTDPTGAFPVKGINGAHYILVMFCANYIHLEPMKSKEGAEYVRAFAAGTDFFQLRGIVPHFERMDNEKSALLQRYCDNHLPRIHIQHVPPAEHRANKAERAIRTMKNHLIATLCAVDKSFPLPAWELLLPQVELTLNLLRSSAYSPNTSAYQALHGPYNFCTTPIAPPGMAIVAFDDPSKRATFAPHGTDGFYVGPAMQHHRCYTVFIPSTGKPRVVGQLSWHPTSAYHMPGHTPLEELIHNIKNLDHSLRSVASSHPELLDSTIISTGARTDVLDSLNALRDAFPLPFVPSVLPRVLPVATDCPLEIPDLEHYAPLRVPVPPEPVNAPVTPDPVVNAPTDADIYPITPFTLDFADAIYTSRTVAIPVPVALTHPERSLRDDFIADTHWQIEAANFTRALDDSYAQYRAAELPSHGYTCSVMAKDAFAMDQFNQPLNYKSAKAGPDSAQWTHAEHEELVRLIDTTKTMVWIDPNSKPADRIASYYHPQVKLKFKEDKFVYRVRGVYGGNISDYVGMTSSTSSDMQTFKLLLNAVVSEGAHFMTADISDFYLGSPLSRPEYMRLTRAQVPATTQALYGESITWVNDMTMVQINNGIYGLPQAGFLAKTKLIALLARNGYHMTPNTECLFRHDTLDIAFALVVDDFAIKYSDRNAAEHLLATIRQEYRVEPDWAGSLFLGMSISFDQPSRSVSLSMPGYVAAALKRFDVTLNTRPTHSPLKYYPINYGSSKAQEVTEDTTPPLNSHDTKYIQQVIGVFLYYARAVDPTMLAPLNKLASRQALPTEALLTDVRHFLQYAASHPTASLVYKASDMRLVISSDASYLSETRSRSRVGGHHYLSSSSDPLTAPLNGGIEAISVIIPAVVSAASEAELAGVYINAQAAVATRNTLADLGYPQGKTPILTDNSTAQGIAHRTVRQKRSKAMDMRWYWIQDRVDKLEFKVIWGPGPKNTADYYTKAHPAKYYIEHRHNHVSDSTQQFQ